MKLISLPIWSYSFWCVCVCVSIHGSQKRPFGYVSVLQEEDVSPSDGQRDVLNQLRDWDLWCVAHMMILDSLNLPCVSDSLRNPIHSLLSKNNAENTINHYFIRGPLFICLSLAIILSTKAPAKQTSHVFTTVFIVMWVGAFIVTVNAQLLGASISIFQSLCVSHI